MEHTTPILIVGAGPTGLMLAVELTRYGIPFRIIDKKVEPTQTTNAAGIQTRTLEIFEHIGLIDEFLAEGYKATTLTLNVEGKKLASMPLNRIDSHFPFILLLPQSKTEAIFNQHLLSQGVRIERSVELIDIKVDNKNVISTLKQSDGTTETVNSNWLVGCDGYHSLVRDKVGIQMKGSDIEQEFVVADVKVKSFDNPNTITMFFTKGTVLGMFPLGDNTYRLVTNSNQSENKKTFTADEIKTLVSHHSKNQCEITEIIWSSPFWIHSKLAETLRKGPVFIAGDAAHVHSPAGAQGMNTGLQDAYNLAWKLALVEKYKADVSILDSYEPERYPIIKSIVTITEKLSHLVLTSNPLILGARNFIMKYIAANSIALQNVIAARVTQLSLNYRKSPLIDKDTKGRSANPEPGDRVRDVGLQDNKRLYDYLRNTKHNLLLFTGLTPTPDEVQQLQATYHYIDQHHTDIIKPYVITQQPINLQNVIIDKELAIHTRYNVSKPSMCLIRPDQYIALFMEALDTASLQTYMAKWGFK